MKEEVKKHEIEDSCLDEYQSDIIRSKGYDGPIVTKIDCCGPYNVVTIDCARQWLLREHGMHIYTQLVYNIDKVEGYEGWCYKENTVSMGSHFCFETPERALAFAIGLALDFNRTFNPKKKLVKDHGKDV